MSQWYSNPNWRMWEWYYFRNRRKQPAVSLPVEYWRPMQRHCETLYLSRIPLIRLFVPDRINAYGVSAALVWNGFVGSTADPAGPRTEPVPVYHRAWYFPCPIRSEQHLLELMNEAWRDAFLCWCPTRGAAPSPRIP